MRRIMIIKCAAAFIAAMGSMEARAGDWYDLWLRYTPVSDAALRQEYRARATEVVVQGASPVAGSARDELRRGLSGLLEVEVPASAQVTRDGAVIAGCPAFSPLIAGLGWEKELAGVGDEGFIIRSAVVEGHPVTVIAGGGERGALYGAFRYLRHLQLHGNVRSLAIKDQPRNNLRLLNHWDNWPGTREDRVHGGVTRGYAGGTLWKWRELPDIVDPRYRDYARANASIGINGSVINNVNATPHFIQSENLPKVAALADVFRAYGIRLYLSVRYDSPMAIGGLKTADPLDSKVQQWWREKVAEIYRHIPDFGGFLVKGDSEGQPGPLRYRRNHAVGANMLAAALRPHGGIVMWRTFVYGVDGLSADRLKQGYEVFKPLDGQFADNVILQAKNGPLDFQAREPVNPLFGQMPKTQMGIELQLAQEYTGASVALCWLIPQWKEIFDFDTMAKGPGSTVQRVLAGSLFSHDLSLVAGVANTGSDRNWTGHPLAQANWYGFGRLAWDPALDEKQIADEWTRMVFSHDDAVFRGVAGMLLGSWRTFECYTSPIGLGLMVEMADKAVRRLHPAPAQRQPFHKASATGIGYDRTRGGSGYVDQYHPPVADMFNDLATCPEELLLWFQHVPYTHVLKSGRTLIQEMYASYREGVREVESMIETWESLDGRMDPERHADVRQKLREQLKLAELWRDTCVGYFSKTSGIAPAP